MIKKKKPVVAHPVFFRSRDMPNGILDFELLKQAEKVTGYGRIKVIQKIDGIWRIHASDKEARLKLVTMGLTIRGKAITPYDQHPNTLRDAEGNIIETTKLTVSNIPWSLSEDDVVHALKEYGVEFTSELKCENLRSPDDHTLVSRCFNGKLYFFIKKPSKNLPTFIYIGTFKAYLHHKEQRQDVMCNNCYERGHIAKKCPNPTKCSDCKKTGHKKGDRQCETFIKSFLKSFKCTDMERNGQERKSS